MAKGIRINLLAKELGVESRYILEKLRKEGLADIAENHMSTLSLGLAESVREWFAANKSASVANTTEEAERKLPPDVRRILERQRDFKADLDAALKAENRADLEESYLRVKGAVLAHAAVIDGVISVVYRACFPNIHRGQIISAPEKLEHLCKLANRKSGTNIKPIRFRLKRLRNLLSHPGDEVAEIGDLTAPSPAEIQTEELRISAFFEELLALLMPGSSRFNGEVS